LSLPKIKLIISGKRLPASTFNLKVENILDIRLSGLEENNAVSFLREHNLIGAENLLYQAFEITRGYPESLLWVITAVNVLKITPFDLIKEYVNQQASIEDFAATKILERISFPLGKLIWFFAVMRHPVKKSAILKLNLSENIEQDLESLVSMMILTVNNNSYYIKNPLKEMVYSLIPQNERIKTHKFIQDLYVEQISKKLEERILTISRRLMHSEQYYHYVCSMNKRHDNINHKEHYSTMISMNNDYNYISPKLSDMLLYDAALKEQSANIFNTEKPDKKSSLPNNHQNIPGVHVVDFSNINENLVIDLSDEEKALLAGEEMQEDEDIIVAYTEENLIKNTKEMSSEAVINELIDKAINSVKEKNFEIAINNYKKVYEISQKLNDINTRAKVSWLMGDVLHQMRKYDEATGYLNESLELFSDLNDSNSINSVTSSIASVYNDCYKHDIALKYYHKLLSRPEDVREEILIKTLIGVGDIYYFREDFNQALKCYTLALIKVNKEIEQKNTDILEQKPALYFKTALIYDDIDNFDKALEFYQNTIKTNLDNNTTNYLSDAYANIATIYEELNKKNDAIDYYSRSLEVDKKLNNYEGQYKTLSIMGNIYFENNDRENAYKCFYEELTVSKLASEPYWTANRYLDIGDLYLSKKLYEKAIKAYIKARKTIGKTISTDSKEKIDRRFREITKEIGAQNFNMIIENLKKKNG